MPASPVLDSYALALLRDEQGSETVLWILEHAGRKREPVHMTEVNYAEVQYIVRRKDGDDAWAMVAEKLKGAPSHFTRPHGHWRTWPLN